ncbi:MAG: DNA repair protein RecN [Vicinamibacterales bacterium]|nr:DNA repair protein RecN [Vicinamibacterales bacterium]
MIRFLRIKHLAVIEELELELEPGLTVLTGETGAGKSIIVGALALLLGARASADLVRTGEAAASIEAVFERADGAEVLVRREVGAQGRSRAYIDDALATTGALRTIAHELVDLHGQHAHQRLLAPRAHLDLLDEFAGTIADRARVGERFGGLRSARAALETVRQRGRDAGDRQEVVRFQLAEIVAGDVRAGEADELRTRKQRLANADAIQRLAAEGHTALYEGEGAILDALAAVWRSTETLGELDSSLPDFRAARNAVTSHLEELAYALRERVAEVDDTAARLQEVEDRLATLEALARKYGQGSVDRVLERRAELEAELQTLEGGANQIDALAREVEDAQEEYQRTAERLSKKRRAAAPKLAERMEALLAELAMPETHCEFRFDATPDGGTERGIDGGELYLAPNAGEEPRPLARIASGGELSRVMLALTTAAAPDAPGRTLVFDEVDAGIGGRAADVVGQRLSSLGRRFQVLCVTHLPQIAAYGATQVEIAKKVSRGRTTTSARGLAGQDRVEVIAAMMAGGQATAKSRQTAAELLEKAASTQREERTNVKSRTRG